MVQSLQRVVHVVDDDPAMRATVQSMLSSVGYEVCVYERGADLLEVAAALGLSGCVVLDVRLPGPGGLEVQRRLAELGQDIPVIFVTGYADVEMAVQAMKARAIEFLTKPFRDQDLLDAISAAMEAAGTRARLGEVRAAAQARLRSLSAREQEIFVLLCRGRLGKQIAHDLGVSEATVKVHRRNLMQKLGVSSISQLILQFGAFAQQDLLAA